MQKARFILSKSKAIEQYDKVKQYCDIVSYSSKTNPDITKVLENYTDSMFSVHSINELKHIHDMSRVIFIAQAWTLPMISKLVSKGIIWFIVDNASDLDMLISYLDDNGDKKKINLFLRVRLKEHTVRTEKYFVFGFTSKMLNIKLKNLRNNPLIGKLGFHFHRSTQNIAEWNLRYEISNIIDKGLLEQIDIINIGGGLPSVYANTNADVMGSIFSKISSLRQWLNSYNVGLMIEPGRFIAAPAVKLVTTILSIDQNNITVNASVYNSDMDSLIVPVKLLVEGEQSTGQPYVIKGITPCSMDMFRYRVYLDDPKVNDRLIFLNAGAYNFSSDFCDLEKLDTEVVE